MKSFQRQEITRYIRENPNISAKALASTFGYSQYHFSREFKANMGVSLRDYLSAIRVERGLHDLIESNNVTNAQLEAGYENLGTFSQVFKQFSGFSPKNHIKKLTNYVNDLTVMDTHRFQDHLLYAPFNSAEHKQPHSLRISIHNRHHTDSLLFVAFFPQALPKDIPNLGICMKTQTTYTVTHIPNGAHYLMVVEILPTKQLFRLLRLDDCYRDIIREPVVFPLTSAREISLHLRPIEASDPPINVNPIKLLFDVIKPRNTD